MVAFDGDGVSAERAPVMRPMLLDHYLPAPQGQRGPRPPPEPAATETTSPWAKAARGEGPDLRRQPAAASIPARPRHFIVAVASRGHVFA